jgi:hypothetical protein
LESLTQPSPKERALKNSTGEFAVPQYFQVSSFGGDLEEAFIQQKQPCELLLVIYFLKSPLLGEI